eukprot:tig00020614_g12130.t1
MSGASPGSLVGGELPVASRAVLDDKLARLEYMLAGPKPVTPRPPTRGGLAGLTPLAGLVPLAAPLNAAVPTEVDLVPLDSTSAAGAPSLRWADAGTEDGAGSSRSASEGGARPRGADSQGFDRLLSDVQKSLRSFHLKSGGEQALQGGAEASGSLAPNMTRVHALPLDDPRVPVQLCVAASSGSLSALASFERPLTDASEASAAAWRSGAVSEGGAPASVELRCAVGAACVYVAVTAGAEGADYSVAAVNGSPLELASGRPARDGVARGRGRLYVLRAPSSRLPVAIRLERREERGAGAQAAPVLYASRAARLPGPATAALRLGEGEEEGTLYGEEGVAGPVYITVAPAGPADAFFTLRATVLREAAPRGGPGAGEGDAAAPRSGFSLKNVFANIREARGPRRRSRLTDSLTRSRAGDHAHVQADAPGRAGRPRLGPRAPASAPAAARAEVAPRAEGLGEMALAPASSGSMSARRAGRLGMCARPLLPTHPALTCAQASAALGVELSAAALERELAGAVARRLDGLGAAGPRGGASDSESGSPAPPPPEARPSTSTSLRRRRSVAIREAPELLRPAPAPPCPRCPAPRRPSVEDGPSSAPARRGSVEGKDGRRGSVEGKDGRRGSLESRDGRRPSVAAEIMSARERRQSVAPTSVDALATARRRSVAPGAQPDGLLRRPSLGPGAADGALAGAERPQTARANRRSSVAADVSAAMAAARLQARQSAAEGEAGGGGGPAAVGAASVSAPASSGAFSARFRRKSVSVEEAVKQGIGGAELAQIKVREMREREKMKGREGGVSRKDLDAYMTSRRGSVVRAAVSDEWRPHAG